MYFIVGSSVRCWHTGHLPDNGWSLEDLTGAGTSINALSSSYLPFPFSLVLACLPGRQDRKSLPLNLKLIELRAIRHNTQMILPQWAVLNLFAVCSYDFLFRFGEKVEAAKLKDFLAIVQVKARPPHYVLQVESVSQSVSTTCFRQS